MATTSTVYTSYAQYYYSSWKNASDHVYTGGGYYSRLRFNLALGGGRKIKITSCCLDLYRNDGGTAKPPVDVRFNANTSSVPSSSATFTAGTGHKRVWFSSALLNAITNMNNKGNFDLYIRSSSSVDVRYTGYNNSNYSTSAKPYLYFAWDYVQSSGSLSNSTVSNLDTLNFTVEPSGSDYTHVVEWYINGEETPYYTQNLAVGEVNSQCTFFGDTPSGSALAVENYFSQIGESVPVSIKLITYNASGTEIGANTYSATMTYTNSITTIVSVSPSNLFYGDPITISLKARNVGNTTILNHYIEDKICYSESLNIDEDTVLTTSYSIDDVYNYFSYYSTEKPFKLEVITYDSNGENIGSVYYHSTIRCEEKRKKLIQINYDIVVTTDTIISNNYFDSTREIFSSSINRIKNQLVDYLRPVGSIYMSYDSTDPSELFGGTWEEYSPARTLMSTIDETAIGSTGGSFTHTLTVAQMPTHSHRIPWTANTLVTAASSKGYGQQNGINDSNTAGSAIGSAGSGGAHVNTQPYSACYMWIRIA